MPKRSIDNEFLESFIEPKLGQQDSSQIKPITSNNELVESVKETIKKLELHKQIKEVVKSTGQAPIIVKTSANKGMNLSLAQVIKQMVETNSVGDVEKLKG